MFLGCKVSDLNSKNEKQMHIFLIYTKILPSKDGAKIKISNYLEGVGK